MWALLAEANRETKKNATEIVKVFWPSPVVMVLLIVGLGAIAEQLGYPGLRVLTSTGTGRFLALLAFTCIMVLSAAPFAVNWHRMIILGERPRWTPKIYLAAAIRYTAWLWIFLFGSIVLHKGFEAASLWAIGFLVPAGTSVYVFEMRDFFSKFGNPTGGFLMFAVPVAVSLATTATYVFVAGRWLIMLPAVSMETGPVISASSRIRRPIDGFLPALFLVYAIPLVLEDVQSSVLFQLHIDADNQPVWLALATLILWTYSLILGLSVLSVAFRRQFALTGHHDRNQSPNLP